MILLFCLKYWSCVPLSQQTVRLIWTVYQYQKDIVLISRLVSCFSLNTNAKKSFIPRVGYIVKVAFLLALSIAVNCPLPFVDTLKSFITRSLSILHMNYLNPYKPSVLFVGHRQTEQTQIRRRRSWRLIRFSTVCLQNVLLKFKIK